MSTTTTGAARRASSTSSSTTSHRAARGVEEERAHEVDDRDRRRRRAPARLRARARARADEVRGPDHALGAGEVRRRSRCAAPGVVPERDHVGAGGEQPSASFGVIPPPSAAFSPLTTQKSTPSSSRSPGSRSSTRARPGAPNTSATKKILRGALSVARGLRPRPTRGSPRPACSARAPAARRAREVDHASRASTSPAPTDEPTVSAGSGSRLLTETTSDGAPTGWMSTRDAVAAARRRRSRVIPTTVPSTGEYTSVPGRGADVERRRGGAVPPPSWYQTSRRCRRAAMRCKSRARRPRCPGARAARARARPSLAAVVPDRRHARCAIGSWMRSVPACGDDLRAAASPAASRARGRGRDAPAAAPEPNAVSSSVTTATATDREQRSRRCAVLPAVCARARHAGAGRRRRHRAAP